MKKLITGTLGVMAALIVAGCAPARQSDPAPTAVPAAATSAAQSPSRADPAGVGCATLRLLGIGGSPAQYRDVAAVIAGTGDARLAAAAVALHDATGSSLREPNRQKMLDAVLDLAEECLRVTG